MELENFESSMLQQILKTNPCMSTLGKGARSCLKNIFYKHIKQSRCVCDKETNRQAHSHWCFLDSQEKSPLNPI